MNKNILLCFTSSYQSHETLNHSSLNPYTMSKADFETSVTKSTPIIIQHEGLSFNSGIVLNETNYDLWSQMLEMQIAEKEKLSFIRGTLPPPKEKDEGYEKWYSNN